MDGNREHNVIGYALYSYVNDPLTLGARARGRNWPASLIKTERKQWETGERRYAGAEALLNGPYSDVRHEIRIIEAIDGMLRTCAATLGLLGPLTLQEIEAEEPMMSHSLIGRLRQRSTRPSRRFPGAP